VGATADGERHSIFRIQLDGFVAIRDRFDELPLSKPDTGPVAIGRREHGIDLRRAAAIRHGPAQITVAHPGGPAQGEGKRIQRVDHDHAIKVRDGPLQVPD